MVQGSQQYSIMLRTIYFPVAVANRFYGRWIGRREPIKWPPPSSDLTRFVLAGSPTEQFPQANLLSKVSVNHISAHTIPS